MAADRYIVRLVSSPGSHWVVIDTQEQAVVWEQGATGSKLDAIAEAFRLNENYWMMSDEDLRASWRELDAQNLATDYDGTVAEKVNCVEDAILQRIGAPDDVSGDEPIWQEKIREFGEVAA